MFGQAKSFPVVSDVDHQRLVGVAYASDNGDIVITIKNDEWKKEVGGLYAVDNTMMFMVGCQYKLATEFDDLDRAQRRARQLFIEFSTKGNRVLVNNPKSPHDGRTARVAAISWSKDEEPTIDVDFESGPGAARGTLRYRELVIIREDANIKVRKVGD